MAITLQQQVTDLYNRLIVLDAKLNTLALNSRITTIQDTLQDSLDIITSDLDKAEEALKEIQLSLTDAITELRAK